MQSKSFLAECIFESNYEFELVLCSCSVEIDKHNQDCPNYNKKDEPYEAFLTIIIKEEGPHYGKKVKVKIDKWILE